MLKILAPTDFSANSKAGLRFAMQWSAQQKIEILFVHFFHTIRLPQWTDSDFKLDVDRNAVFFKNKLEHFIMGIYKSTHVKPGKYSCLVKYGLSPDIDIIDYCREHGDIQFICIATRGAGKLKKFLGTHTGNLTSKSPVPVITVPKNYRINSIKCILYATDLKHYTEELKKVVSFARPLRAEIKVLHVRKPEEKVAEEKILNKKIKQRIHYVIDLQIKEGHHSLPEDLQRQIRILKPSLIVMFTDQHRNFFQKILFPSKVEQMSFGTKIPLLSFNKE